MGRPRRAMRTTTARADAKNRMPGMSWMRRGLPLGDPLGHERVGRQAHRVGPHEGPEGRQARGERAHDRHGEDPVRAGPTVRDILDGREPDHERAEEEAAVKVRPDRDDDRDQPQAPRVGPAVRDEQQDDGEQRHPEQLRPQAERDRRDRERHQRQERGRPCAETAMAADDEEAAEDEADEPRAEQRQPGPAGQPVGGGQHDLRAPLLVRPRGPGRRERPGVHRSGSPGSRRSRRRREGDRSGRPTTGSR